MGTIRLSWYSNAPWAGTGYGTQTAQVVERLKAAGHDVAILSNHGLYGNIITWQGVDIFPAGTDVYSNDVLAPGHRMWLAAGDAPGWIVTLFDVWVLDAQRVADLNVASWTPVDHSPVPPKVAEWAREHKTLAMSKFGETMLLDQGIKSHYVPHAIEPVFRPTASDVRTRLNIPDDAFLVMLNAANKGNVPARKSWPEMFNALAAFMAKHPDAYVYCHTDHAGIGGLDLLLLAHACGLPMDRIRWPDQFGYKVGLIPQAALAEFYTAADVFLATSMGEGFGIPVIEAQACGTPVIVTNFSAQPELVGGGWTVAAQPFWDFSQAAWLAMPLVGDIIRKLDDSYDAKGSPALAQLAVDKAMEYDADLVFETYWKPVLAEMEAELHPDTRPRAVRRAERRKRK